MKHPHPRRRMRASRRSVLRLTGAGAFALAGGGSLAACAETTRGGGEAENVDRYAHLIPNHVPFNGVQLPESDLLPGRMSERGFKAPDGLLRYPRELVRAVPEPFGNGSTYTSITPLWAPAPDYPNDYYDAIAERMGTTIEFNPRDGNDYQDVLTAILGAQDHPDITMIPGWNLGIPRLSEAVENLFADLTPFLAGDIADRWPLLANLPSPAWTECIWGGKLKALPQPAEDPFGDPLFCRKDILDEMGLPMPTNAEELLEIGRELTDPSRNRWAFGNVQTFVNQMFHVPDQDWRREPDGSLVASIETEEYHRALEFVRQLYDEGLVHPSEGSEAADLKQLFRSGEVVFRADGWGDWTEALSSELEHNPDFDQQPVPFFAHDGGEPTVHGTDPAWGFTFLHSDLSNDQIEEILDVANWLAAPFGTEEFEMHQYGVEDVHFTRDDEGEPQLTEQGQEEAGRPVPTYWFLAGRPAPPFSGPWPGYVESRVEWSNEMVVHLRERIFAGLRVEEPAALQRANQNLEDRTEDLVRGRRELDELDDIAETWREEGGDEGREFYEEALASDDEGGDS